MNFSLTRRYASYPTISKNSHTPRRVTALMTKYYISLPIGQINFKKVLYVIRQRPLSRSDKIFDI